MHIVVSKTADEGVRADIWRHQRRFRINAVMLVLYLIAAYGMYKWFDVPIIVAIGAMVIGWIIGVIAHSSRMRKKIDYAVALRLVAKLNDREYANWQAIEEALDEQYRRRAGNFFDAVAAAKLIGLDPNNLMHDILEEINGIRT